MKAYTDEKNRGFSIIELMVALAVLAVLLSFVGPALQNTEARSDIRQATDLVAQAFRITKSAARITNSSVSMELVTDGANPVINFRFLKTDDLCWPRPCEGSADGMKLPPIQLPEKIQVDGDTLEFTFTPLGTIDSMDTIILTSTINGNHNSSVVVNNNMGYVTSSIEKPGAEES